MQKRVDQAVVRWVLNQVLLQAMLLLGEKEIKALEANIFVVELVVCITEVCSKHWHIIDGREGIKKSHIYRIKLSSNNKHVRINKPITIICSWCSEPLEKMSNKL